MRTTRLFNADWEFVKEAVDFMDATMKNGENVTIPHTWNGKDGQDGDNDYYRGTCYYVKKFDKPSILEQEVWLEFRGVAMSAEVFLNGEKLMRHEGGYSTFRVQITEYLQEKNILVVSADNSKNRTVYPQKADFTFYGGIYRDVYLIITEKEHFALDYYGAPGIKVTPILKHGRAEVTFEVWTQNVTDGKEVTFEIESLGKLKTAICKNYGKASLLIENPHLWNGLEDPYLYEVTARMDTDEISTSFGIRSFFVDAEKGFFLNGKCYPLCGAARHQDRPDVGYAITKEMMDEDMLIMCEMGCNTIRLAHYQHDQYFYDLCDKTGMIVWVEIPYITEHMPEARENSVSQMRELVVQNYNHPSIICWGLSNEITASGGVNEDMKENHRILNELCHSLDKTRPTVMAHAFMLNPEDEMVRLADICSYNLYFGWYLGEMEGNDSWFDDFHEKFPNTVVGLSEYGADANPQYQSIHPEKGDYTESYQALYHEHLIKMWKERPYIWAIHCWNMFDFGADGRNEGGKPGQNQKGLVTFDRKVKKDAFYIYKAYMSKEPFVHLCGKRYVDRMEDITEIKVYSNQKSVTLWVDGKEFETKEGAYVFSFRVPITGLHKILVVSGSMQDEMEIRKVSEANLSYSSNGKPVVNWFDKEQEMVKEGYYSIFDTIADIKKSEEGRRIWNAVLAQARKGYGDVAQSVKMPEAIQKIQDAVPAESVLKQARKMITEDMVKEINHALNQVKRVD